MIHMLCSNIHLIQELQIGTKNIQMASLAASALNVVRIHCNMYAKYKMSSACTFYYFTVLYQNAERGRYT